MSIYAIGDVQGCFAELQRLVDRIHFRPGDDQLWFVGDLVNRGPRSSEVLRFVKGLGDAAITVLGNHDLHLLSCAFGIREPKPRDTFGDVLAAPDRDALIAWLVARPLAYRQAEYLLVHAGVHPTWDLLTTLRLAGEAERALPRDPRGTLDALQEPAPPRWEPALGGADRLRAIVAVLTRIRTCTAEGTMETEFSGPPEQAPHGYRPWFEWPRPQASEITIVCGHWAALGLKIEPRLVAVDSACVWGGALSAVRLDDRRVFQEACVSR
jgi:bis(5'-nucleosyl)-tetraphosphatase (symmetrical)